MAQARHVTGKHRTQDVVVGRAKWIARRILQPSEQYPRFGYRKFFDNLKAQGVAVSRERVRRIGRREGLQIIVKRKKRRLLSRSATDLDDARYPNGR